MYKYSIEINEYNKLITHVDKTIKDLKETIQIYKILIKQLESQDNKQVTKRILNHIKLEGYNVSCLRSYDRQYLYIYKGSFKTEIALCEYKENKLSIECLKRNLDSKEKLLNEAIEIQNKVSEIVSKYNATLNAFKVAEKELYSIPGWSSFDRF